MEGGIGLGCDGGLGVLWRVGWGCYGCGVGVLWGWGGGGGVMEGWGCYGGCSGVG